MAEDDCGLCIFPDLQDNSKDFGAVYWLSIMTSNRIGTPPLSICAKCKHSKQLIYLLQRDFLIHLTIG